jgi:hypothetical protein
MSKSTGAFNGFAVSKRGKSSRKAIPLNIFGGAAVAFVVLGCFWTIYTNVFGASIYPSVATSGFEDAVSPPRHASAQRKSTMALLTAAYPPEPTATFSERLSGLDRVSVAPAPVPQADSPVDTPVVVQASLPKPQDASPSPAVRQVASIPVPPKRPEVRSPSNKIASAGELAQRSKASTVATGSVTPTIFDKLFGTPERQPNGPVYAYASPDGGIMSDGRDTEVPAPRYDRTTAVYDISAHTVYMPDGTKLEAHSGLGSMLDDPRHVRVRMRGATPPHTYDLVPRESLFHGVPALRLKPVGGEQAIFGRDGLLAHTYMLGPNGDSNGCVSFKDYYAFLNAYRNQGIKRLAVLARVD